MSRVSKMLFMCVLIISLYSSKSFANDLSVIKDTLKEIGIPQDYSNNIINYIDNISLSESELNDLLEEGNNIVNDIGGRRSLNEFKINELISLYSDVSSIANEFNLSLGVNFVDKEVTVTDKSTKDILFKGNIEDMKKYYSNLANISEEINIDELQNMVLKEIAKNRESLEGEYNSEASIIDEDTVKGNLAEKDNKIIDKSESDNSKVNKSKLNDSSVNVIKKNFIANAESFKFDFTTLIFAILVAAIFTLLFKILFSKKTT